MSIYEEVKNIGIDLFVSYHPKVIQLKRESKALHKELKSKGLSLMQCQELTAKQNGFNNWYNFIHLIKRHYQQDLDNVPFVITKDKQAPVYSKEKIKDHTKNSKWLGYEENNPILLGYDINFGHYKWQNDNSMKTHQMILGESVYKKYDVYMANQTMKNKRSMLFLNGEGDSDTLRALVKSAIENGRQSDLKIINFQNSSIFPEYECKLQNSFAGSSGMLIETFFSLLDDNELKVNTIYLISAVMMYLAYKRDLEKTSISLEKIREIILLENMIKASQEKGVPSHIVSTFMSYLNGLCENNKHSIEERLMNHEKLRKPFDELLNNLIDTQMFNNDEKSLSPDSFIEKQVPHIYIFQFDGNNKYISKKLQILLLSFIKSSMAKNLGFSIEGNTDQLEEKRKQNRNVLYIFVRSCCTTRGISVLPAQARSLGLSMNFSYSSLTKLEELSNELEAQSILANTNTKIFCTLESDPKTVALLNKYKNDHVWIVKKGYASQVSFDSPYEPYNFGSKNVKITMRVEDPQETYDLFEKDSKNIEN